MHLFDLAGSHALRVGSSFLGLFLFFVFMTSLSHRWAHATEAPQIARFFHKLGLLLPPEHHARHHVVPHTSHYCITSGCLNTILDKTRFFRVLELLVHAVIGLVPREDDAKVIGLDPEQMQAQKSAVSLEDLAADALDVPLANLEGIECTRGEF
jgi:ubiquitin-conjugating enzyme E2 variant